MAKKWQTVNLQIYEVPEINKYIPSSYGLGVYHTGTEVYNREYSYGGHPYELSGIFVTTPKDISALSVSSFKFKETKLIGYTKLKEEDINNIVRQFGADEYQGKKYHLMHKNCNHFSDAFCKVLCSKGIPEWVNKMSEICASFPFIEKQIPREYLTPVALQQEVKKYEKNEKDKEKQNNSNSNT